jgi:hypothetical protein
VGSERLNTQQSRRNAPSIDQTRDCRGGSSVEASLSDLNRWIMFPSEVNQYSSGGIFSVRVPSICLHSYLQHSLDQTRTILNSHVHRLDHLLDPHGRHKVLDLKRRISIIRRTFLLILASEPAIPNFLLATGAVGIRTVCVAYCSWFQLWNKNWLKYKYALNRGHIKQMSRKRDWLAGWSPRLLRCPTFCIDGV